MNIYKARQDVRMKSIYDLPMRVTFYARVSSEKDEQLNSLKNQIDFYRDFIEKNKNWEYVDGYIDEGISGISVQKRENFLRMIDDAKNEKFDFIITKEISRFARNTIDSISYTRQLLGFGVCVLFQNDAINTLDEDSELRLTIMSSIAQDELRKLSSRIKFGHAQAIKNDVVLGNSAITGYKKDKGKLVIDENEAVAIREIFSQYATGEYSANSLSKHLATMGITNSKGNRYPVSTIKSILQNPKYKGFYVGGKVKILDMFSKKQEFVDKEDWTIHKDESGEIVPAIISEEIWNKANQIYVSRSNAIKNHNSSFKSKNLYTGKIICKEHNVSFFMKQNKRNVGTKDEKLYDPCWICSHKIKNGTDSCNTIPLYESELATILSRTFSDFMDNATDNINNYINILNKAKNDNSLEKDRKSIEQQLVELNNKKNKLFDLYFDEVIDKKDFTQKNTLLTQQIDDLQKKATSFIKADDDNNNLIKRAIQIKNTLSDKFSKQNPVITKELVDLLIDKIYVSVEDDTIILEILLFDKTSNRANIPVCRHGHTFKKMIKAYEDSLK